MPSSLLAFLLLPFVLLVYASSFQDLPIIERKHSVLGDADAANYALMLRNFSLSTKLGDEWNAQQRSLGDNAQKHKLHHVLYAAVGAGIYRVASPVYRGLGLPPERAIYAVNAVIAAANIILLFLLLKKNNPDNRTIFPLLAFYSAALSTWVFSSVPESWPFSATLVLLFMLLLGRGSLHIMTAGAALGLIMLNNVFLAALGALLVLRIVREKRGLAETIGPVVLAAATAAITWLGALTVLSRFDSSFRPVNFVSYTIWFKQFTGADLPRTDPYVWKSAATNLFVNSVVSNQPDPAVPQEALQTTLRTSVLGIASTAGYLLLMGVAGVLFVRSGLRGRREDRFGGVLFDGGVRSDFARRSGFGIRADAGARSDAVMAAAWCAVMLIVTVILFYPSGFLYSTVVVPALTIFLGCTLDLDVSWQRALLYITILLILVNNLSQVLQFREALAAMS